MLQFTVICMIGVIVCLSMLAAPVYLNQNSLQEASEENIVLVIPKDKQKEAAEYNLKLVSEMKHKAYNPSYIYDAAMEQTLKIYGVPIDQIEK